MRIIKTIIALSFLLIVTISVSACSDKTELSNENGNETETTNIINFNVSNTGSYDISNFDLVYEKAELVVKGTLKSVGDTTKYSSMPISCSPSEFEIREIIKGELDEEVITILIEGGMITYEEYENSIIEGNPEITNKKGFATLSDEEKKNTYVNYVLEDSREMKVDNSYVLFLSKFGHHDSYIIITNTGILSLNDSQVELNEESVRELFEEQLQN